MKTETIIETPEQSKATPHVAGVSFKCHDCGQVKPVQTSGGTGYATCTDADGPHLVCYECADNRERADMVKETRFTAYVSSDGKHLTTWSGGILGTVSFGKRHPWSCRFVQGDARRYLRAYDCHGQVWHGTGAPGMYCNLRKCKSPETATV